MNTKHYHHQSITITQAKPLPNLVSCFHFHSFPLKLTTIKDNKYIIFRNFKNDSKIILTVFKNVLSLATLSSALYHNCSLQKYFIFLLAIINEYRL